MTSALTRFETQGPSWSERATAGELKAVINPFGSDHQNRFIHAVGRFGAKRALALLRRRGVSAGRVVDFGCGTGRFVRFFGSRGHSVLGVDITAEMLSEARRHGIPPGSEVRPTDGVHIPADDRSVDLVWVCGVLKYTLFVNPFMEFVPQPDPAYPDVAREMYRVLKPGGFVVNVEMFVNVPPEMFTRDFEKVGFATGAVRVLQRYTNLPERLGQFRWLPRRLVPFAGTLCAAYRHGFDNPGRPDRGMRDYLFVWSKPRAPVGG
jgi:ubiquinone/menaquinone biosynthesis C-methylase UbiE